MDDVQYIKILQHNFNFLIKCIYFLLLISKYAFYQELLFLPQRLYDIFSKNIRQISCLLECELEAVKGPVVSSYVKAMIRERFRMAGTQKSASMLEKTKSNAKKALRA